MAKPIAPAEGIAFAFPDVCKTPTPVGDVPIPYPNIAQLEDASEKTNQSGKELKVAGKHILLQGAEIKNSNGDEAGVSGGIISGKTSGKCQIILGSLTVVYGPKRKGIVRFMDPTTQNDNNTVGMVLSANPTVLVGG